MENLPDINDILWNIGKKRIDVISPLAEQRKCSKASVAEAAKTLQLSTRHIYQLIRACRASQGMLTSLIPKKPMGGKGKSRLSKTQESVINAVISNLYLTSQKLRPAFIVEEVRKLCIEKISLFPELQLSEDAFVTFQTANLK